MPNIKRALGLNLSDLSLPDSTTPKDVDQVVELETILHDSTINAFNVRISKLYFDEELITAIRGFNIVQILYPHTFFTNDILLTLSDLKILTLNNTVTDEGLQNLSKLEELYCDKNRLITDKGLHYLTNLSILHCDDNTNFTDEGLKGLPNLVELYCDNNTNFTDEVLKYLPKLEVINTSFDRCFSEEAKYVVMSRSQESLYNRTNSS